MQKSSLLLTAEERLRFLPLDVLVREIASSSIPPKSREEIARLMSASLGRPITKHMMDSWLAPGREHSKLPCAYVAAFCEATGNDELRLLLLGPELLRLLELGEAAACVLRRKRKPLETSKQKDSAAVGQGARVAHG